MEALQANPRGQKAEPADYRLGPRSTFTLGADLGQSIDPTAICVIERRCFATGATEMVRGVHEGAANPRAVLAVRRIIRGLELLPLGMSYYDVADHLAARRRLIEEKTGGHCSVVFDETGARGTGEIIREQIPSASGVTLTGGDDEAYLGDRRWSLPKAAMVTRLLGAIEARDLEGAADLTNFEGFVRHLVDLRRKVSTLGRYTFNAREGGHDDYVTAAGLAYWWASRPIPYIGMIKLTGW